MKKLLLFGSALMLSIGASAQLGYNAHGAYDDFATSNEYTDPYMDAFKKGVYWFETTSASTLKLVRAGNGYMELTATNAGGCNSQTAACYPAFGVNFGQDSNAVKYTMDLSGKANIILDIENTVNKATFMTIILTDINGKEAKIEPNVSDLSPSTTWATAGNPRKGQLGFTFGDLTDPGLKADVRKNIEIDLTSVSGKVGGLSAGAWTCDNPYNCPVTTYDIDITKIVSILFQVNFGKDNIFVTEGNEVGKTPTDDHTNDTFIEGTNIAAYTGGFKVYSFGIGDFSTGVSVTEAIQNSLKVYPNPASDQLNVSFEAKNAATVSMTDIFGRTVYTSSVSAGNNNITVNTSSLSTGIYILNVTSENGTVSSKVNIK